MQISKKRSYSKISLPIPFGAHLVNKGTQFTLFARHATKVWLMFFDSPNAQNPRWEVELDARKHRIGDIWHIFIPKIHAGQFYLYRMEAEGDKDRPATHFIDPDQWLIDPYAQSIAGGKRWGDSNGIVPGVAPKNGSAFPKCVVVDHTFDWSHDESPQIPLVDAVIYEMHVRGYTIHPSSRVQNPGTYAGIIEKIPYLKRLGITSIELMPIHEFNEMEYLLENGTRTTLRNFWGYSTQNFFSPMGRYSASGICGGQVREFKKMVRACHRAGIEVILDVVFNHTDEGNENGPIWSMRGIDNSIYYITGEDGIKQTNYTGCGNTINTNHPVVRQFILNCLHYWHLVMHVDGFRFDLASIFARGQHGEVLDNPPIIEAIAEDPALVDAKIIAEAWDAAGLYQVGSFPNRKWAEWNGCYRDDIREFWNGPHRNLRTFVTRLIGSPDLYAHHDQTPEKSINFITCHDGFTLNDLVSYNEKNNLANGEENRDGENHNRSYNYGEEGPTKDPQILAVRKRQMKNLLATLLLSQGVPMILAGDEFARTQKGNNNSYCQDSDISWVDWSLLEKHQDLHHFVRKLIAFRRTHPILRKRRFLSDRCDAPQPPDIRWHGPDANPVDWDHGECIAAQFDPREERESEGLFIIFNASDQIQVFYLPQDQKTATWHLALSTQESVPSWRSKQKTVKVEPRSVNVFRASRL